MSTTSVSKKFQAPKFSLSLLAPKFWLTWIGISFLYLLSWLPLTIQFRLGSGIGSLLHKIMKRRRDIALTNLQLCFPNMPEDERKKLVLTNFKNAGIALFESGMSWWWPKWRVQSIVHVKGQQHIDSALAQGKGIFLLFFHVLPLEMMARVLGEKGYPCVGFYRPHNNKVLEWVQYRGRCVSNKYMVGKWDVKGLLKALSKGEVTVYLPDHDYGKKRSVFVPFFDVAQAATTTGTEIFASHKNATTIPTKLKRLPGTQGYEIEFLPPLENYPGDNAEANATLVNQWVEEAVADNMEQYMWVHRRFKTRPNEADPSLYK
ncbi:LpxL/LpxP family Kdo(2)-lipid IV(A) lauroyl/palmitoleoyl acyltransferase [Psychrosphaera sp. B3R10]|uniref:LpxL/LpxP family Kdo(2)-lipid IV(A) lauroyl/palmitoleoyl acyltransferase n=1 Tax=unclassified Psychrosphaera TaxID=2641570 RepID=UPI001C0928F1|nr:MULTISPECIES: LpxL/LpxP family Kdo(2)-lipid IV(A) lauroyl/palmitoleoyl acyltransferase [unclassified Psychrosphaera]MBU2882852.1 LpxL/LpxP family Kdo(2)-lipid IV(A) lauroyl/palmitoleoyl acyltransferase [Psychrosphaera sp. I2R16]MBU2990409.1 LpxL/LpxP family Kdo(2)-lipid IV(A) lauroyl/palmitoleoyl acyltransferase [Psychrosphaera sp. B3R10]